MRVYLDDERKPGGDWVVTHTPAETIALLETGEVEELSLDHDVGGVDLAVPRRRQSSASLKHAILLV